MVISRIFNSNDFFNDVTEYKKNNGKNAFSEMERNSILKITVKNDNNIEKNTEGG